MLAIGILAAREPGSAPASQHPADAAAADITQKAGLDCLALLTRMSILPDDVSDRVARSDKPAWVVPGKVFAGTLAEFLAANRGLSFGKAGDLTYVNGVNAQGEYIGFRLLAAEAAGRPYWIVSGELRATSCEP